MVNFLRNLFGLYPRYCAVCGRKLERVDDILGFNPFTGKPKVHVHMVCPMTREEPEANHASYFLG